MFKVILLIFLTMVQFDLIASPFGVMNSDDFIKVKKLSRELLIQKNSQDKSVILDNDRAEEMVDRPEDLISNLEEMEDAKLLTGKLNVMPWSDSYWPIYTGSTALRYNDSEMSFETWPEYKKYYEANPAAKLIMTNRLDELSPAEKYDFIFSLKTSGLTNYSWNEGEMYFKQFNKVETWMGLCHGWAVASMILPDPKKDVEVNTIFGKKLTLHPSDIKALGTQLFANGNVPSKFIGGRCDIKNPKKDSNGRVTVEDCIDNNPGTWHKVITHQIGKVQRSFIMDATYDYEVWNQPVYSYRYQYFHPVTNEKKNKLSEAIISINDFKNDERKAYRHEKTTSVVGIEMKVKYVVETEPSIDEDQESIVSEVTYRYDLELDSKKNIIGGEWYSKAHPDFLWLPKANHIPSTFGDSQFQSINLNAISKLLSPLAKQNASMGLPLSSIVKTLFNASKE